jgi:hypothetical protein
MMGSYSHRRKDMKDMKAMKAMKAMTVTDKM